MRAVSSLVKWGRRAARRNLIVAAAILVLSGIPGVRHIASDPGQTLSIAAFAAANVAGAVNQSTPEATTVDGSRSGPTLRTSQLGSAASDEASGQKAVLYEEDPNGPPGARYEGTVNWRVGSVPSTPRQPNGLAILADVDIPQRKIRMTLSIRQNADVSLPASHVAELAFTLPADFSGGQILSVKGILMKAGEQAKAAALTATVVRVRDNFFMIGTSNVEAERSRNVRLLKENSWVDIPIVYENQQRAILALEKGEAGDHAFDEAFAAWGQ
jgi:hypothetical protein